MKFKLEFTQPELQKIVDGLMELQYKKVAKLINRLVEESKAQVEEEQKRQKAEKELQKIEQPAEDGTEL